MATTEEFVGSKCQFPLDRPRETEGAREPT